MPWIISVGCLSNSKGLISASLPSTTLARTAPHWQPVIFHSSGVFVPFAFASRGTRNEGIARLAVISDIFCKNWRRENSREDIQIPILTHQQRVIVNNEALVFVAVCPYR